MVSTRQDKMRLVLIILFFCVGAVMNLLIIDNSKAGSRFTATYSCSDAVKMCTGTGVRIVDGFSVHRDCWEWQYIKTCSYPSKNDCRLYEHCYSAGDRGCLLQDSLGNCVNMKKEFSCKSWDITNKENQKVRTGFEEKEGKDTLVCKGMPCIDGNCVDKSYNTNGEMMDSLSKLYATSHMNPDKDGNFNLFQGSGQSCSKKPIDYNNCCVVGDRGKGWGKSLGAKCTKDELTLMDQREKKLCVYVGKKTKKVGGVPVNIKHSFCCFGNLLDKVIQVEGRKQLGRSFGSGGSPDCRGLSLEDIQSIDWSKVDFSEFIEDLKVKFAGKYKTPNPDDLLLTVEHSIDSIRKYDDNPDNPENNMTGWNGSIQDNSYEADEEKRLEQERQARLLQEQQEREKLAKLEEQRLERERLAKLEAERLESERLVKVAKKESLQQQIKLKEKELVEAKKNYQWYVDWWNRTGSALYQQGYKHEWDKVQVWEDKKRNLEIEIQDLSKQQRELGV